MKEYEKAFVLDREKRIAEVEPKLEGARHLLGDEIENMKSAVEKNDDYDFNRVYRLWREYNDIRTEIGNAKQAIRAVTGP